MAHPVSPLAPKTYPELPPIAGVRFATAEAGIKYKGRTDVLLAAFDPGTTVAGRLHLVQMPVGAGRLVPRQAQGRRRRGGCWSIRATPTLSPA